MRSDMDHTVLPANYTLPAFTPAAAEHHRPSAGTHFFHPTEGRRLSRLGWLVTYRNKSAASGSQTRTLTNRAQRRLTLLIETNTLPLRQTATTIIQIQLC